VLAGHKRQGKGDGIASVCAQSRRTLRQIKHLDTPARETDGEGRQIETLCGSRKWRRVNDREN
jgi:hypothetical protein